MSKKLNTVLLVLLIALVLGGLQNVEAAPPRPQFYQSEWTAIPGNDCAQFTHGFDRRPLTLTVWVALAEGNQIAFDPSEAQLWTDGNWNIEAFANHRTISACNYDDGAVYVQVVAQGMK